MRRTAFLDRDGVINVDRAYVHCWEDFVFVPGARDTAAQPAEAGWTLVVVTNQSGIARGYYSEEQPRALRAHMDERFATRGGPVAAVYHCPYHSKGMIAALAIDCSFPKPSPYMLLRAARELNLSLPTSIMISNKPSDSQPARTDGVGRADLVHYGKEEAPLDEAADQDAEGCFDSLADCVRHLPALRT